MQETFRKIRRVVPVIRARQAKVDQETAILTKIRDEKQQIVASMRTAQQKYMKGVTDLNSIRNSSMRERQEAMEKALDFVKNEWYRLFEAVQEAERKEKEQIAQVLNAEKELKATEKLKERYEVEHSKALGKQEQKRLDESALRKYITG